MRRWLAGTVALVAATFAVVGPAVAGIDEAYRKPADRKSWGELLADFVGHRGFGKSYALVVGISKFDHYPSLPTSNDPLRMRDFLLHEAGFDYVHVLTDETATKARIEELMVDILPGMVDEADQFLLYWSGHGTQRSNALGGQVGYLPLASSPTDRFGTMISMTDIQRWDALLRAKQALFLLDACFSGLAGSVSQSGHRELQIEQLDRPAHHLVSAGTGEEQTIAGDVWDGSIFADAVLRAVRGEADAETSYPRDGVVSLSELIGYVKTRVAIEAPKAGWTRPITPQLRDLRPNAGEFFFLTNERKLAKLESSGGEFQKKFEYGMPVVVMGAVEQPLPVSPDRYGGSDVAVFGIIKDSAIVKDFETFLEDYPESAFASYARNRLAVLTKREMTAPSAAVPSDVAAGEAALNLRPEDRMVVEEALAALGFHPGGIDDIFGADTRRAIVRWQRDNGEEPTGYLSATQYGKLLAEAEPKLAALPAAPEQPVSGTPPPAAFDESSTVEPDFVFDPGEIRRAIEADLANYDPFATTLGRSDHLPGELAPALSVVEPDVRSAGSGKLQVAGYVKLEEVDFGQVTAVVTPVAQDLLAVRVESLATPRSANGCTVDFEQRTFDLTWDSTASAFTGLRAAFSPIEVACPDLGMMASDFRIDSAMARGEGGLWSGHLEVALEGLQVAEAAGRNLLRTDAAKFRMTFGGFDFNERARLLERLPAHYWPRRAALLGIPFDFVAADLGILPKDLAQLYAREMSTVDFAASLEGLQAVIEDGSQSIDVEVADGAIEARSTAPSGLSYRHDGLSVKGADIGFPTKFALDLRLGRGGTGSILGGFSDVQSEQGLVSLLQEVGPVTWQMESAGWQSSTQGTGQIWVKPGAPAPSATATLLSADPTDFLLETFLSAAAQEADPTALRQAVEETVLQVAQVVKDDAGPQYRFEIAVDFENETVTINGIDLDDLNLFLNNACSRYGC